MVAPQLRSYSHPFLLVLLCSFSLWAVPKRPDWVTQMPSAPHLYQGFGVADETGSAEEDRLRADQNARTEIVQEISSTIRSDVSSYYQEAVASGDFETDGSVEVFSSLSSSFAEATIEGVKIVDRYFDKQAKVYYSYATLSRAGFEEQLHRKASEAVLYARNQSEFAQRSLGSGDIRGALNHLGDALNHALVAQSITKTHLMADLDGDGKSEFLDAALSHKLTEILNDIQFIKLQGDDQKGERDQALSMALTGRLLYQLNGETVPVSHASLAIQLDGADAEFEALVQSGDDGSFSFTIDKIISADRPNPKIQVNLNLPQIAIYSASAGTTPKEILPAGLVYTFKIDVMASVKIFVRILEEINGDRASRSKSDGRLIKELVKEKYKVIDASRISRSTSIDDLDFSLYYEEYEALAETLLPHADYAIVGLVSSETSSTGTINYARASTVLNVLDLNSGRILSSGNQSNVKAAGNTEDKANAAALKKCSDAAISDILAGLKSALN